MSKKCSKCGTKLHDNVEVCHNCGKVVEVQQKSAKLKKNSSVPKQKAPLIITAVSLAVVIALAVFCVVFVLNKDKSEHNKTEAPSITAAQSAESSDVKELGEGKTKFDFTVVDKDGNETKFVVKTDKKTVGEALLDAGLIEGDEGPYGLYVKKVNGITADYDVDGTYWGFFVNDTMAPTGVDMTEIKDGESYAFKVSK